MFCSRNPVFKVRKENFSETAELIDLKVLQDFLRYICQVMIEIVRLDINFLSHSEEYIFSQITTLFLECRHFVKNQNFYYSFVHYLHSFFGIIIFFLDFVFEIVLSRKSFLTAREIFSEGLLKIVYSIKGIQIFQNESLNIRVH